MSDSSFCVFSQGRLKRTNLKMERFVKGVDLGQG